MSAQSAQRFLERAERIIRRIEDEIALEESGNSDEGSGEDGSDSDGPYETQLSLALNVIKAMVDAVEADRLPPKGMRATGLGRMLVDSYTPGWELGDEMIELEHMYERL